MKRRGVVAVKLEGQKVLPPAVLRKMEGTRWWLENCHMAVTLKGVDGITNPQVRSDFSRFRLDGVLGILPHKGLNAWLKRGVDRADAGKSIAAGIKMLDLTAFQPDAVRPPGTHCKLDVVRPEDGNLVRCCKHEDHEGPCKARAKRVPGPPRVYARR